MATKKLPGINIQYPISRMIIEGTKKIETRTYPIPNHYIGKEMVLVETPGKEGKFKSRAIGVIKFRPSFKYDSKSQFYSDVKLHCVTSDSPWAWDSKKGKWGWPVEICKVLKNPIEIKKRLGIKFTKDISI